MNCIFLLFFLKIFSQTVDYLGDAKNSLIRGDIRGAIKLYNDALAMDSVRYASANYLLGNIYVTQGNIHLAVNFYKEYIKADHPNYDDAYLKMVRCHFRLGHFTTALEALKESKISDKSLISSMENEIRNAEKSIKLADEQYSKNKFDHSVVVLEELRKTVTHSADLLRKLIISFKAVNNNKEAISAMKFLVKVVPDDTSTYYDLSLILLDTCQVGDALDNIRKCLVIDQDNAKCKASFRIQKKLKSFWMTLLDGEQEKKYPEIKNTASQLEDYMKLKKLEISCISNRILVLRCIAESRDIKDDDFSLNLCSNAIKKIGTDSDDYHTMLLARAHIYLHQNELQLAKNDVLAYLENNSRDEEANQLKTKIERLIKQAGKRNYYKILGVSKKARKLEINRAYRKLALKWHPDKHKKDQDKDKALLKYQDINDAYEVLTDKKKRQMFDDGIDPLDQEEVQNAQRGGHQSSGNSFFDPNNFNFFGGGGHYTFNF